MHRAPLRDRRDALAAAVAAQEDRDVAAEMYAQEYFPVALQLARAEARDVGVLVLTAGMQPWSIAISLTRHPAQEVVAIVSPESRPVFHKARELAGVPAARVRDVEVDRADSAAVYRLVAEAIARHEARGGARDDVRVDFTSGTKAMTAGLSSVAGYLGITQFYVASERLGKHLLFGREEIHEVDHPVVVFGDATRLEAERAFDDGHFTLAGRLFAQLQAAAAPGFHYAARAALSAGMASARALRFKEAADHVEAAAEALRAAHRANLRREPLIDDVDRLAGQASALRRLHAATRKGATPFQDAASTCDLTRYLLARSRAEAPDLAALLAYRALELAIQRRLWVHLALVSGSPRWEDRPELVRALSAAGCAVPDKVDLARGLAILHATDDPALATLTTRWPVRVVEQALQARNHSLWAHGFQAVSGGAARLYELSTAHARAVCGADGLELPSPDPEHDPVRLT